MCLIHCKTFFKSTEIFHAQISSKPSSIEHCDIETRFFSSSARQYCANIAPASRNLPSATSLTRRGFSEYISKCWRDVGTMLTRCWRDAGAMLKFRKTLGSIKVVPLFIETQPVLLSSDNFNIWPIRVKLILNACLLFVLFQLFFAFAVDKYHPKNHK